MALTNFDKTDRKEKMAQALASNTPTEVLAPVKKDASEGITIATNKPSANKVIADAEEDYEYTRNSVKSLIETSTQAIEILAQLAQDAEHPRAFEVLANMLKSTADMNNQLTIFNKERKKILADDKTKGGQTVVNTEGGSVTNNIVFAGSTDQLQQFLDKRDGIIKDDDDIIEA